jgi:exopolysaccharide production protein ExoZ
MDAVSEPKPVRKAVEYKSVQTLRAVGAILVALMHILFFYGDSMKYIGGEAPLMSRFYSFQGWAGCGVQIFFVISGFIMAYLNAIGETDSFRDFAMRRITRVVPLYWILTLFWAYVCFAPGTFPISRVLESLFFIPRLDNTAVLGPGWSLNFEMFFYAIFGLITLVFRASFLWVAMLFVVFNVLGQVTGFYVFDHYSDPIVWNFIAGIAIYHVHRLPWALRESRAIFVAGVTLLVSAIFWHKPDKTFGLHQFMAWGVPSMLVVFGAVSMEAAGHGRRLFGNRVMLELGNASYALYLVHTICFVGVSNVLLYHLRIQHFVGPDLAVIVYLAVCCLISIAVHHLVEKPSTRYVRKAVSWIKRLSTPRAGTAAIDS